MTPVKIALLGPQRFEPNLAAVLASLEVRGPVAAITAGWEEREAEAVELEAHLGCEVRNLRVFERGEQVFRGDPELRDAMRTRHTTLRRLRELYILRLGHALSAARELLSLVEEDPALLDEEVESAIESVRLLDAHHLARVSEVLSEFDERLRPHEREAIGEHRDELRSELASCSALMIAGGHVAILLNRLRLFGVTELLTEQALVGWSAGAMVLSERVALFHDSPPQGPGDAEIFGPGLGLCRGVLPLPHASRRLQLEDPVRVGLFARRFAPDLPTALDVGSGILWDGRSWSGLAQTQRLSPDGTLSPFGELAQEASA